MINNVLKGVWKYLNASEWLNRNFIIYQDQKYLIYKVDVMFSA